MQTLLPIIIQAAGLGINFADEHGEIAWWSNPSVPPVNCLGHEIACPSCSREIRPCCLL